MMPYVWGISDFHGVGNYLSPYELDQRGADWIKKMHTLAMRWKRLVSEEDIVLIPGDLSFAPNVKSALWDLEPIGSLPGTKLICKGNHDHWWRRWKEVSQNLPPSFLLVGKEPVLFDDLVVCGITGFPAGRVRRGSDRAELKKLERQLRLARKKGSHKIIVMLHYPPMDASQDASDITDLLEKSGVDLCVYGHLHSKGIEHAPTGLIRSVEYHLVSVDAVGFTPYPVAHIPKQGEHSA